MNRRRKDLGRLRKALREFLGQIGLSDSKGIQRQLNISQPAFSRLAASMRSDLLVFGRARATRYALRREISDIGSSFPVYEISDNGNCQEVAILHAISPEGFFVKSRIKEIPEEYFDDLPYFLDGLRPVGFLGRLIPRLHPEFQLPTDIRNWSAEHCLRYLCRMGWNLSGNLLVGEEAKRVWEQNVMQPPDLVDSSQRNQIYPIRARDVLSKGNPGSSAAGEHPKFLATRSSDLKPIIVKFVLNTQTDSGRRSADLLVGEHIAHEVLASYGQAATKSELVRGTGGELFLEMERFDRTGTGGRLGLITLEALDSQFVGRLRSWTDSAQELANLKMISRTMARDIRWLELFGRFICNTDMHLGNVSFISKGAEVVKLAPVYDMLPMLYVPREFTPARDESAANIAQVPQGEFTSTLEQHSHAEYISQKTSEPEWIPPTEEPQYDDIWSSVVSSAIEFWQNVSVHPYVSKEFVSIAQGNIEKINSI